MYHHKLSLEQSMTTYTSLFNILGIFQSNKCTPNAIEYEKCYFNIKYCTEHRDTCNSVETPIAGIFENLFDSNGT